jgi:DNA invertase Pin-like site-specific DNA recombinase
MTSNLAAVYLRVSTDEQALQFGLASQRSACQRKAEEKGWTIIRELQDEVSGASTLRPGLTELRRMVAAGEVNTVICYSVDRLSRDLVDVLNLTREIQQHAALEYATESFPDSAAGRLFLSLRGAIGAFEREQILARTQAGMLSKARSGKIPGGMAPYGYRLVDGHFVIHDDEAAVVRQIYSWAGSGVSQRDIARRLNERGVRPYRAAKWGKTSVGRMIGHEVYVGTAVYNASHRRKTTRPADEPIMIPVPPIIDRALYEAAVVARAKNQEMLVGRPSRNYMLTSILRCSCGMRMVGDSGTYRCLRQNKDDRRLGKACKTQVSAAYLDARIWTDGFLEIMTDPRRLRHVYTEAQDQLRANWNKGAGNRAALEAKIAKLAAKEKRILDMMVELDDRAELKAKRDEARAERLRHEAELKAMVPVTQLPNIDEWVTRVSAMVEGKHTARERRDILRDAGVEIIWDGRFPQMNIGVRGGGMFDGPWPTESGKNSPARQSARSAKRRPPVWQAGQ